VGVSSEPQHVQLELTPADKLLILASDGVWEFISSKEAVEMVGGCDTPEDGCRLVSKALFGCKRMPGWLAEDICRRGFVCITLLQYLQRTKTCCC
jgi:hypothetical protein